VEFLGRHAHVHRVAADLVECSEAEPAIERSVFHTLGHHRTAGLLEAHHELVAVRPPATLSEREGSDQVQRVLPLLGQPLAGSSDGVFDDASGRVGSRLTGDDV